MTPRIALVGPPDAVSAWLLRSIASQSIFEAICHPGSETLARQHQARWTFPDAAAMFRDGTPDGVIISHEYSERPRLIKQTLAAGAGVLVCGSPGPAAACKRLASFAKLSGRVVMAAPPIRFSPAMLLARRLIESGRAGIPNLICLRSTRRGEARSNTDQAGRLPVDQIFEAADILYHLAGPMQQVFATAHEEDVLVASAQTLSGVPVSIVLHANGPVDAVGLELEVRSRDGSRLRLDTDGRLVSGNGSRMHAAHQPSLAVTDPAVELGYDGIISEFIRYLRAGRTGAGMVGPVSPVALTAEAILASAARGRPIAPRLHPGRRSRAASAEPVGHSDA
jgi:predicted dehydrogenase